MNRKTWSVVLVVLLVLVAAGAVPRTLELARALLARVPGEALRFDRWRALLAGSVLLGLGSFLLAVRGALAWFEERGPRGGVLARARQGHAPRDIARSLSLSQDAVRLVLRTDAAARPRP